MQKKGSACVNTPDCWSGSVLSGEQPLIMTVALTKDEVIATMAEFSAHQPHVIFWNSEYSQLQWLHAQEDRLRACGMYTRMADALKARLFSSVSAVEPVTVDAHTYFPMLTHSPGQDPNPVHLLLAGEGVCGTPYYFLDQKLRDSVLQTVHQFAQA